MILQEITNRLRDWLPIFTDQFTDSINITNASYDSGLQEVTLDLASDIPVNLLVGGVVTLSNVINSIPLDVLQGNNGNGIAITDGIVPHDVTRGGVLTVEFNNSSIATLNGIFNVVEPPVFQIASIVHDGIGTVTVVTVEDNFFPSNSNFRVLVEGVGGGDYDGEFDIVVIANNSFTYQTPALEPAAIINANSVVSGCFSEFVMFFGSDNASGGSISTSSFLQKHRLGFNGNLQVKQINSLTQIILDSSTTGLAIPIGSNMLLNVNPRIGFTADPIELLMVKKVGVSYIYVSFGGATTSRDRKEDTDAVGTVQPNQVSRFNNIVNINIDLVYPADNNTQRGGIETDLAYAVVPAIDKVLFGFKPTARFVGGTPSNLLPINESINFLDNGNFVYRISYEFQEQFQTQGYYTDNSKFGGFLNTGSGDGIISETIALRKIGATIKTEFGEKNIDLTLKQG